MQKRIHYLDIVKSIGIIFVILGHIESLYMPFRNYIVAFHMPLFFIVSGMLFYHNSEEERNIRDYIKGKAYRIMIPYAFFSILSLLIESSRLALKGIQDWTSIREQFLQAITLQGVSTLWFLPALFLSQIIFFCIRKWKNHFITIGVTFVITVCAYYMNQFISSNYLLQMLLRAIVCTSFILIGYYL